MNAATLLHVLSRRWIVLVPIVAIVVVGALRTSTHVKATYVANGSVLLLAPQNVAQQQASPKNPYVDFTGPIRATASVLEQLLTEGDARSSVVDRGGVASYSIDVPPEGPIVEVHARASTPGLAVQTVRVLSGDISTRLKDLQDQVGTPPDQQITSAPLTSPTSATAHKVTQVRDYIGFAALGIPAALSLGLAAEAWSRRRAERVLPVDTARLPRMVVADSPTAEDASGDRPGGSSAISPPSGRRLVSSLSAVIVVVGLLGAALATWFNVVFGLAALALCVAVAVARSRVDVSGLVTGVFALALFVVPSRFTFGPFATTVPTIMGLGAAILLLGLKVLPGSAVGRGRQLVVTGTLVYLGAVLISYVAGHLRVLTELERKGADRHLAVLVGFVGMMLLITYGTRSRARLDRLLLLVVAGAGAMAAVGILQFTAGFDISRNFRPPGFKADPTFTFILQRAGLRRVAGTAAHPIEFGVVCGVMLPLAFYYAVRGSTATVRNIARVSLVLLAVGLPMALSRSGLVVLATVLIVLLPTMSLRRRVWVLIVVLCGVALLYVASPNLLRASGGLISGHVGQVSLQARSTGTQRALVLAGHTPLLGRGYGTFDSSQYFVIDNLYVVTIVEVGLVGLGALLTMFFSGWSAARRIRRSSADPATRDLAQTLAAMLAGGAMGGWGLDVLQYPMIGGVIFLILGSIGALSRFAGRPADLTGPDRQPHAELPSGPLADTPPTGTSQRPTLQHA